MKPSASYHGPKTVSSTRVYFIRIGAMGPIKIGITDGQIATRLADLQTAIPWRLHCVGYVMAEARLEPVLHQHLARFRMMGEWFLPDPAVLKTMEDVLAGAFEWPAHGAKPVGAGPSPILHLDIPPDLVMSIRSTASKAGLSPQALVIDALCDIFPPSLDHGVAHGSAAWSLPLLSDHIGGAELISA